LAEDDSASLYMPSSPSHIGSMVLQTANVIKSHVDSTVESRPFSSHLVLDLQKRRIPNHTTDLWSSNCTLSWHLFLPLEVSVYIYL